MNGWQVLSDNIGWLIFIIVVFGGSIWAGIQWMIKHWTKHQQEMQRLRNEELQLQMQIQRQRRGNNVPKQQTLSQGDAYQYDPSTEGYTPLQ